VTGTITFVSFWPGVEVSFVSAGFYHENKIVEEPIFGSQKAPLCSRISENAMVSMLGSIQLALNNFPQTF